MSSDFLQEFYYIGSLANGGLMGNNPLNDVIGNALKNMRIVEGEAPEIAFVRGVEGLEEYGVAFGNDTGLYFVCDAGERDRSIGDVELVVFEITKNINQIIKVIEHVRFFHLRRIQAKAISLLDSNKIPNNAFGKDFKKMKSSGAISFKGDAFSFYRALGSADELQQIFRIALERGSNVET